MQKVDDLSSLLGTETMHSYMARQDRIGALC